MDAASHHGSRLDSEGHTPAIELELGMCPLLEAMIWVRAGSTPSYSEYREISRECKLIFFEDIRGESALLTPPTIPNTFKEDQLAFSRNLSGSLIQFIWAFSALFLTSRIQPYLEPCAQLI
jgi:hypothetical protein